MAGNIIAVILGLIAMAFVITRKSNVVYLLFFILFFQGLFEIFGISMSLIKYMIELLVWSYFLIALLDRNSPQRHIPGIFIFIGFLVFYIIAIILAGSINLDSYSYFRHHLNAFLLFAATYLYSYSPKRLFSINRFIFFLMVLQILSSAVKLYIYGRSEEYVGTMVITSGTMHTIFPIFAIIFMTYAWMYLGKERRYLLYIAGFMFMGWVGDKRGIYFYLAAILIILFWRRLREKRKGRLIPVSVIRWAPLIPFLIAGVVYFGVRLTPSLNPERKVWGKYDGQFLTSYLYYYNVMEGQQGDYRGRLGGTYILVREFVQGKGIMIRREVNTRTLLTGFGPNRHVGATPERLRKLEAAGIYRPPGFQYTGFTQSLLATGIIGVSFLLWLFIYYIRKVGGTSRLQELNPYWKTIVNSTALLGVLFLFDYFTYSGTFYSNNTIYLTFFFFVGQSLKPDLLTKYNTGEYPSKLI